jgi:hypothetical protein
MLGKCTSCGTSEVIGLLDGKSPSGSENDDFTLLECIRCYGPDWHPNCDGDIKRSFVPQFAPLYDQYLASRRWIDARNQQAR